MAYSQARSKRKQTGSRYVDLRKRRKCELGNNPSLTRIGKLRLLIRRVLGAKEKRAALSAETANLYDPKSKKYQKAVIKNVVENAANRNFARRNIVTKGSIIETDKGKARVTSRPGQTGSVNAVLV